MTALAVLALALASCATAFKVTSSVKKPPPLPANTELAVDSYFPLTDKSQWSYKVQDFVRKLTYQSTVRVYGKRYIDSIRREGINVEERYSSFGPNAPYVLEEQEPMLYFRENGYLNRMLLTYQAGKVIAVSGSQDIQYLPEVLKDGQTWDSDTQAFKVGDLGFKIGFRHAVAIEPSTIKVPAGDFEHCVRVDTFSTEGPNSGYRAGEELIFYYSDWYAPGVGLVLTRQYDDAKHEHERTRIELTGYVVEPPARTADAATGPGATSRN